MAAHALEEKLVAAGWGKDRVTHFIRGAQHNVLISFLKSHEEFNHVIKVGLLLEESIKAVKKADTEIAPIFKTFLGRSYGCYLASVRLSSSGQFTEACALFRVCIENALYAFYINRKTELSQVWLDREKGEKEKTCVRNKFRIGKMLKRLEEINPAIGEHVRRYYENTIGFGAHPNIHSVGLNLNVIGDWDMATLDILNAEDEIVNKAIGLNALAGLLSLSIFSLIYTEQFNKTGIIEKISTLFKYHEKLALR